MISPQPNGNSQGSLGSCHNPFHILCLEAKSEIDNNSNLKHNNIIPNFRCPTCLGEIEGSRVRLDAIQIYSVKHQRLVNIFDTSNGVVDHNSNRVDASGKDFIANPDSLRTASVGEISCVACLGEIVPAHESVVHHDRLSQCLAAFHSDYLSFSMKGHDQCPKCLIHVEKQSYAETAQELSEDARIEEGTRPARTSPQMSLDQIRTTGHLTKVKDHPDFIDLVGSQGPPKEREDQCGICFETFASEEPTWLHKQGRCFDAWHQNCLQQWIDQGWQIQEDEWGVREDHQSCPKCKVKFNRRPAEKTEIEFDSGDAETRFDYLSDVVQEEVLSREQEDYSGWPLLVWTDRLV